MPAVWLWVCSCMGAGRCHDALYTWSHDALYTWSQHPFLGAGSSLRAQAMDLNFVGAAAACLHRGLGLCSCCTAGTAKVAQHKQLQH